MITFKKNRPNIENIQHITYYSSNSTSSHDWLSGLPEEPVVGILQCGQISLGTQTQVKVGAWRRPWEIERAAVEEFPQLWNALFILGWITQWDERCCCYTKYVGFVNFADRHTSDNQCKTEHRLFR